MKDLSTGFGTSFLLHGILFGSLMLIGRPLDPIDRPTPAPAIQMCELPPAANQVTDVSELDTLLPPLPASVPAEAVPPSPSDDPLASDPPEAVSPPPPPEEAVAELPPEPAPQPPPAELPAPAPPEPEVKDSPKIAEPPVGAEILKPKVKKAVKPHPKVPPKTIATTPPPDPKPPLVKPAATPVKPVTVIVKPVATTVKPVTSAIKPVVTAKVKPSVTPVVKVESDLEKIQRIRGGLHQTPLQPPTLALKADTGKDYDAGTIKARLGSQITNDAVVTVGHGSGGGSSGGLSGASGPGHGDPSLNAIKSALHRAWQQPTRAEVGDSNPVTLITMTIHADGTLTNYRILAPSRNTAMDESVEKLFRNLHKLPPLSSFGINTPDKTIKVAFTLD